MSDRGYRIRVQFQAIFEYRYLAEVDGEPSIVGRSEATIFTTAQKASAAITRFVDKHRHQNLDLDLEPVPSFDPDWTIPTGEHIQEQLDALGVLPGEFVELMGIGPERTQALLEGTEPLTRELAERLCSIVHGGVEFWLKLEFNYRDGLKKGRTVIK